TGATSYTLDPTLLAVVRVERQLDTAGRCMPLREIGPQEQTYWRGLTGSAYRYSIANDQLYLLPTPPTGDTYTVRYIPHPPDLTIYQTTDNVDVFVPAGEQYLINGAALLSKGQTEGDLSMLSEERDAAMVVVQEWAAMRAFSQPPSPFVEDYDVSGLLPNS